MRVVPDKQTLCALRLARGTVYHSEKVLGVLPIILTLDNVVAGVPRKLTIAVVAPLPFLQIALQSRLINVLIQTH